MFIVPHSPDFGAAPKNVIFHTKVVFNKESTSNYAYTNMTENNPKKDIWFGL